MNELTLDISARVLIVDDDEIILEYLRQGLETFGCQCDTVTSVAKARGRLARELFDLILLDISMPDERGDALLKEMAPRAPETIVVMMTAETDIEQAISYLRAGAYDYLCKPFDLTHLRQVLDHSLKQQKLEIENRRYRQNLERMVEKQTAVFRATMEDLLHTRQGLVQGLCRLAEFRDDETGRHLERMSEYARLLAIALSQRPEFENSLTPPVIDQVYEAAPLHDIGKVGIPDRILLKAGKLTPEEFEEMKRHTDIGAGTIRMVIDRVGPASAKYLNIAADICKYHHERWDGAGYPCQLKEHGIPIPAQIITLVDFYDATTFPRVYRPYALPHDEVIAMMIQGRAKQFRPEIVDAFVEIQDQILAIKSTMGNKSRK
ncbi:MAG: response regulator [Candidatus Sumerlaeota bacterium]|nr:response regulator [Candidatus Sumerlaeota bacterium]